MKRDYFFCYNYRVKDYLMQNGLKFIVHAITTTNSKPFWLFEASDELDRLLKEYKSSKNSEVKKVHSVEKFDKG